MQKELRNLIDRLIEELDPDIDVNTMSLEELKNRENEIVSHPVTIFLSSLKENDLLQALIEDENLSEINDVKEIRNHFLHLSYKAKNFIKKIERYRDHLEEKDAELDNIHNEILSDENLRAYNNMSILLNMLSPLFVYIDKIFSIGDTIDDKAEYVKLVSGYNKKYLKTLKDLHAHVIQADDLTVGNPYTFEQVEKLFSKLSKTIDPALLHEEKVETQTKPRKKVATIVEPQINPAELERQKLIRQANEQYERICVDYLRDYDKQIPHHLREEYNQFRNVTLTNFIHEHKMPLHENSSSDAAKAALKGISNKNKSGILDILEDFSQRS